VSAREYVKREKSLVIRRGGPMCPPVNGIRKRLTNESYQFGF